MQPSASGGTAVKGWEGPEHGAKPPAGGGGRASRAQCRVEGCTAPLQQAKRFYQRQHICERHFQALSITDANGRRHRFCQQCTRLHPISEFEGTKRSCRSSLARRQERRAALAVAKKDRSAGLASSSLAGSGAEAGPAVNGATSGNSSSSSLRQAPPRRSRAAGARAAAVAAAAAAAALAADEASGQENPSWGATRVSHAACSSVAAGSLQAAMPGEPGGHPGGASTRPQHSASTTATVFWAHLTPAPAGAPPVPGAAMPALRPMGGSPGSDALLWGSAAPARGQAGPAGPAGLAEHDAAGIAGDPALLALQLEWLGDLELTSGTDIDDLLAIDADSLANAFLLGSAMPGMLPGTHDGSLADAPAPGWQPWGGLAPAEAAPAGAAAAWQQQHLQQELRGDAHLLGLPASQQRWQLGAALQQHQHQQQQQQPQGQLLGPLAVGQHCQPGGLSLTAPVGQEGLMDKLSSTLDSLGPEFEFEELRASLKLHGMPPEELPLEARASLQHSLQLGDAPSATAVRAGCVHLTLSALASRREAAGCNGPAAAAQALARLPPSLLQGVPRAVLQVGTSSAALLVGSNGSRPAVLVCLGLDSTGSELLPSVQLLSPQATTVSAAAGAFQLRCSPALLLGDGAPGGGSALALHCRRQGSHLAVGLSLARTDAQQGYTCSASDSSSLASCDGSEADDTEDLLALEGEDVEVEAWVAEAQWQQQLGDSVGAQGSDSNGAATGWQAGWGLYEFEVCRGPLLGPAVPALVLPDRQARAAAELATMPPGKHSTSVLRLLGMVLQYQERSEELPPAALARVATAARQLLALAELADWPAVHALLSAALASLLSQTTQQAQPQTMRATPLSTPPPDKQAANPAPGSKGVDGSSGACSSSKAATLGAAGKPGAGASWHLAEEDRSCHALSPALLGAFSAAVIGGMVAAGTLLLCGGFS